ncbi:hypothetical protein LWI29_012784 [Acer saccharum]|uniref:Uncharacterized protein n=1 Tax=Acer saccharum TaxID=4024 RepID=A0AA39V8D5_ACESA|nr:hypothetical protein LWI29_012784 [Acer saccharum]
MGDGLWSWKLGSQGGGSQQPNLQPEFVTFKAVKSVNENLLVEGINDGNNVSNYNGNDCRDGAKDFDDFVFQSHIGDTNFLRDDSRADVGGIKRCRFHFEAYWVNRSDCRKLVASKWQVTERGGVMNEMVATIQNYVSHLNRWNRRNIMGLQHAIMAKRRELHQASSFSLQQGSWRAINIIEVSDLVGFGGGILIASTTALSLVIPNWVLEKMTFEATSLQTKRNLFPDKKKEASLLHLLLLAFDALSLALELPSVNSKVQRERWGTVRSLEARLDNGFVEGYFYAAYQVAKALPPPYDLKVAFGWDRKQIEDQAAKLSSVASR